MTFAPKMSCDDRAAAGGEASSRRGRPERAQLRALTGLRFLAALLVLLFHTAPPAVRAVPVLGRLIARGYVGVSCFFVLSGFILAYNYLAPAVRVTNAGFWWARFARIYPLYLFALLVSLPYVLYSAHLQPDVWTRGRLALTLATAPTLTQSWLPTKTACAWNCPGWSLSVEAFFYLIFPVLGALVRHRSSRALLGALVALGAGAALPGLFLAVNAIPLNDPEGMRATAEYFPPLRLFEFAMGVCLGVLFLRRAEFDAHFTSWGALAALAGAVVGLVLYAAPNSLEVFLHTGGLALLFGPLVYCLGRTRGPAAGLATPAGVVLGEASYALYLLHEPIWRWWSSLLVHGAELLRRLASTGLSSSTTDLASHVREQADRSLASWSLYVLVAVALSVVALRTIEHPARRRLRALAPRAVRGQGAIPTRDVVAEP